MEQKSVERVVTVVLRFLGVLTIFIGLILTSNAILQLLAAHSVTSGMGLPPGMNVTLQGAAGRLGNWTVVARIAVIVWGALLVATATPLARSIAKEDNDTMATSVKEKRHEGEV
jgi:hypothetical protein